MEAKEEEAEVMAPCCLVHAFFDVAARRPRQISIIHASVLPYGLRKKLDNGGDASLGERERERSWEGSGSEGLKFPQVYPGDVVYTYEELQSAVEILSRRLAHEFALSDDQACQSVLHEDGDHEYTADMLAFNMGQTAPQSNLSHPQQSQEKPESSQAYSPKRVGIWTVQSAEYLVAALAVLKAGGAFFPLDPSWPLGRIIAVITTAKPFLVIGCQHARWEPESLTVGIANALDAASCAVLWLPEGFAKGGEMGRVGKKGEMWRCASNQQRSFCYVLYTSGSSGIPKGVCGSEEVGFIDHLTEALGPLLAGTPLLVPPPDMLRENPLALLSYIEAYGLTRITAVPSLMRALLPALQVGEGQAAAKSLRVLVMSGEPLSYGLWQELHSPLGHTTILNLYGSTELSGDCTFFDCTTLGEVLSQELKVGEQDKMRSVPIGEPINGCWVYIVSEDGLLVDPGEEGELWVGGVGVAHGYLDDPEGTREKFWNTHKFPMWSDFLQLNNGAEDDNASSVTESSAGKLTGHLFKTGDRAKKLANGSIALLGRIDRQIKIRGHRIALEDIEINLEEHPQVKCAAVSQHPGPNGEMHLVAYVVPFSTSHHHSPNESGLSEDNVLPGGLDGQNLQTALRQWLAERLPVVMVPTQFIMLKAMPLTASGKVNYLALPHPVPFPLASSDTVGKDKEGQLQGVEYIREVFVHVLGAEKVAASDNFFAVGGTSISAAHAAYMLGVDMPLLYTYPTAMDLHRAISLYKSEIPSVIESEGHCTGGLSNDFVITQEDEQEVFLSTTDREDYNSSRKKVHSMRKLASQVDRDGKPAGKDGMLRSNGSAGSIDDWQENKEAHVAKSITEKEKQYTNRLLGSMDCQMDRRQYIIPGLVEVQNVVDEPLTDSSSYLKRRHEHDDSSIAVAQHRRGGGSWSLQQQWKVSLQSCVDASPLLVVQDNLCRLFIGSHSHNFLSVDAVSGEVQWEARLGGRVESTAAVTRDFTQVVVGCYDGLIYFFDFWSGQKVWSFNAGGEVKCQPALDTWQGLIWCGSHSHHIYALDATVQTCVWQHSCAGSIFGAPAFDQVRKMVYVAATNGLVTAIKSEPSVHVAWTYACGAPVFGSIAVDASTGLVLCTSVNASITALTSDGSLAWQAMTDGPIFAGACISSALPSQVLVCSRDGNVYSVSLQEGKVLWKYEVGEPIASSAWVDESLILAQADNRTSRFVCVASTSGTVHVLSVETMSETDANSTKNDVDLNLGGRGGLITEALKNKSSNLSLGDGAGIEESSSRKNCDTANHEIARLKLPGDVFSSPIMVGGRIFVGCRDNHLYSIDLMMGGMQVTEASLHKCGDKHAVKRR